MHEQVLWVLHYQANLLKEMHIVDTLLFVILARLVKEKESVKNQ